MPAILKRLRDNLRDLAARVSSVILNRETVDVSLGAEDDTGQGSALDKTLVFRLDCSRVVLNLDPLGTNGLDDNSLSRILGSHTSSGSVQRIVVSSYPNITTLPACIGKFTNIWSLDLSHNSLSDLPWVIVYLRKLTELNLSNNKFTSIPPIIGHLTTLETLVLKDNDLRYLPTSLIHLQHLKVLDVSGNKNIRSPPRHVCDQGKDAVMKVLKLRFTRRNLWKDSQRWYTNCDGHLKDDIRVKSLLEHCVATVLQFKVEYLLQTALPPPLKRYLHEKETAKMEVINVAKCSRCSGFFSSQLTFDSHDC
ncbi:hypothetical protein BaRGS_00018548 [Batillaria attramentaria]|uniref:Uncharacterized protein n=1 Tax=Batillaria attramentaria TaxID=370345 RepID=A0ABD0KTE5_9CAEN